MTSKKFAGLFLFVGFLGFLDATYLTVEHFQGTIPPCSVVQGCERVLTSPYATAAGIPVALLGALYYLGIVVGALFYFDTAREKILEHLAWFTSAGLLASLWFLFLQAFILHSFCQYCLLSAATSTTLFGLGMWYLLERKNESWLSRLKRKLFPSL